MPIRLISSGLVLLLAMQTAAAVAGDEETSKSPDAIEQVVGLQDREREIRPLRRPRRVLPDSQRPARPPASEPRPPEQNEPERVPDLAPRQVAIPPVQAAPREPVQAAPRETVVVRLEHLPAVDAAETIRKWLASEAISSDQRAATVVAEPVTNSLVVSGPSEQSETIQAVLLELDRPAPQIRVEAVLVDIVRPDASPSPTTRSVEEVSQAGLGEIVAQLKQQGEVRVLAQLQLRSADNQPASLQLGSRVPRVTSSAATPRGRTNQVALENVGTILGITGRVTNNEGVTLEIDLERSHLGAEEEGTLIASSEDGSAVRMPQVQTLTLQTTVSLRSGQTVVLGGMVYQSEQVWRQLLLLLRPEVIPPGGRQ